MRTIIQNLVIRPFVTQQEAQTFIELTSKYHGAMEVVPLTMGFLVKAGQEAYDTDGLIRGFNLEGNLSQK
jgi:hypothetical protein